MILEPNKASSPSKGRTVDLGLITLAKTLFLNKVPFAGIAGLDLNVPFEEGGSQFNPEQ